MKWNYDILLLFIIFIIYLFFIVIMRMEFMFMSFMASFIRSIARSSIICRSLGIKKQNITKRERGAPENTSNSLLAQINKLKIPSEPLSATPRWYLRAPYFYHLMVLDRLIVIFKVIANLLWGSASDYNVSYLLFVLKNIEHAAYTPSYQAKISKNLILTISRQPALEIRWSMVSQNLAA